MLCCPYQVQAFLFDSHVRGDSSALQVVVELLHAPEPAFRGINIFISIFDSSVVVTKLRSIFRIPANALLSHLAIDF